MQRTGIGLIAGLALMVLLVGGLFGGMMMGPGMMGGYWGYGGNSWWGTAMIAFWVLVIVGGIALVASLGPRDRADVRSPDHGLYRSREILRERYARGEITREQYEQIRRDLEAD